MHTSLWRIIFRLVLITHRRALFHAIIPGISSEKESLFTLQRQDGQNYCHIMSRIHISLRKKWNCRLMFRLCRSRKRWEALQVSRRPCKSQLYQRGPARINFTKEALQVSILPRRPCKYQYQLYQGDENKNKNSRWICFNLEWRVLYIYFSVRQPHHTGETDNYFVGLKTFFGHVFCATENVTYQVLFGVCIWKVCER